MFTFLDPYFQYLNSSTYFIGFMMILLNIGSKYFMQEIGTSIDYIFSNKLLRRLLVFTVFFVATRDVKNSLIMTFIFVIVVMELFNEKSKNCILPDKFISLLDTNKDGKISKSEIENAMRILQKSGYLKKQNQDYNNRSRII